jgi:hypothetical protein
VLTLQKLNDTSDDSIVLWVRETPSAWGKAMAHIILKTRSPPALIGVGVTGAERENPLTEYLLFQGQKRVFAPLTNLSAHDPVRQKAPVFPMG